VTWQPESAKRWPDGPGREDSPAREGSGALPGSYDQRGRRRGSGVRLAAFVALLAVGLGGLAVAAVGVAHQLLPRQFTAAQQRQIIAWEMERRWRALPAGKIFPESVHYQLSAVTVDASGGLVLDARRLGIARRTSCDAAVSAAAARILSRYGCSAALRATYVDSSGSMVATVAVVVLPDSAAARTVVRALGGSARGLPMLVRPLRVPGTPAAGFGTRQRQLSGATFAGPYVLLSTAGFADGRPRVQISADPYLDQEMTSLTGGLVGSAGAVLGSRPPAPVCPGTPGC
jgi:hypothetical protein